LHERVLLAERYPAQVGKIRPIHDTPAPGFSGIEDC
jgi:hypothetical protein